jgi:hypothetical protein
MELTSAHAIYVLQSDQEIRKSGERSPCASKEARRQLPIWGSIPRNDRKPKEAVLQHSVKNWAHQNLHNIITMWVDWGQSSLKLYKKPKTAIWQRIFWKRAKKMGVKNTVFTPFPEESPLFYPKNHFFTPSQISPFKKPFFALLKHGFLEEAKKKAKKEAIRTPRLVECIWG